MRIITRMSREVRKLLPMIGEKRYRKILKSKKLGLFTWQGHREYLKYYREFYCLHGDFYWERSHYMEIRQKMQEWREWRGSLVEAAEMWEKRFWREYSYLLRD